MLGFFHNGAATLFPTAKVLIRWHVLSWHAPSCLQIGNIFIHFPCYPVTTFPCFKWPAFVHLRQYGIFDRTLLLATGESPTSWWSKKGAKTTWKMSQLPTEAHFSQSLGSLESGLLIITSWAGCLGVTSIKAGITRVMPLETRGFWVCWSDDLVRRRTIGQISLHQHHQLVPPIQSQPQPKKKQMIWW